MAQLQRTRTRHIALTSGAPITAFRPAETLVNAVWSYETPYVAASGQSGEYWRFTGPGDATRSTAKALPFVASPALSEVLALTNLRKAVGACRCVVYGSLHVSCLRVSM